MNFKVPFIKPKLPSSNELDSDFKKITENNIYTNSGPFEKELEEQAANYVGSSTKASVVNNATSGLILAIEAIIGHKKQDDKKSEILVPSFTFAAPAESIIWCGYTPVFMDIKPTTLQSDIEQAEDYIIKNNNVAAILLCNTFGVGNTEISKWETVADANGLPLIIDSAAGFGSKYSQNERLGARGSCEVFSLHATKTFAIGEGGLVISKDQSIIKTVNRKKNFGFGGQREVVSLGMNAKTPEIMCAVGVRQLARLDQEIAARKGNLSKYKELLEPNGVSFQDNDSNSSLTFATIVLPKDCSTQGQIVEQLAKKGIQVRDYYNPPLHKHKFFEQYKSLDLRNTEEICSRILSLPIYASLQDGEINEITRTIKESI